MQNDMGGRRARTERRGVKTRGGGGTPAGPEAGHSPTAHTSRRVRVEAARARRKAHRRPRHAGRREREHAGHRWRRARLDAV